MGEKQAKELVNNALVLVSLGGNDFVNNYFLMPFSARSFQYTLPDYTLHEMGVRRAILMGSGPLGCAPAEIAQHGLNAECATELQAAAALYEPQLAQMVQDLNAKLGSRVFIAANTKLMHNDFIKDPQAY
ncbi:GDSL esterase/lipase-like protein, partial [Tanacetum coccineum]